MAKDIVLKDVSENQYWKWKREKDTVGAANWTEFFKELNEKAKTVEEKEGDSNVSQ